MQNARAIKKRYVLMPLAILLAGGIFWFSRITPFSESIIKKFPLSNLAVLYVTEGNAGATTAWSYRFYLYDAAKSEGDFAASIKKGTKPFLITSDKDAEINVDNGNLTLSVHGTVYSYHSNASYRLSSGVYSVPVYLQASPY
ncbi:hypothetical protein [Erwinia billingiae]|uniref:hypothetical protein n=1 Tax=Erwinia billingiae TaxID=182337 RepID=UPI0022467323|nr:hypothetical protein [Erwinia billingiae]